MASTVIVGISQQHAIVQEDIFGSVLAVLPYDDLSQAVVLAGPVTDVWSENISRVHQVIPRLKTARGQSIPKASRTPVLPEGGTKQSGSIAIRGVKA